MKNSLKLAIVGLSMSFIGACSDASSPATGTAPPPPTIDVVTVSSVEYTDWHTYTTRTAAPEEVQLRPRVSGVIETVTFNEGSRVQQGDVLFSLDKRALVAEVNNLEAQLTRSKAALRQAKSEYERGNSLADSKAISVEQMESRRAIFDQRKADVDSISSSLNIAKLNLDFSDIKAPISGTVSLAFHTRGNTVTANQTILTTIVATDTIETYFEVDERTWNNKFAPLNDVIGLPVRLELTGAEQAIFGKIDFVDNAINVQTGTIKLRGSFDNSDRKLLPGAFARVSIAPTQFTKSIIVPERAIGTDLKNKFILVVNQDNTLAYRPITLGKRLGAYRVIKSGLNEGESVAANGPAKVGPGMPITPNIVELELPKELLVQEFMSHYKNSNSMMGAQ